MSWIRRVPRILPLLAAPHVLWAALCRNSSITLVPRSLKSFRKSQLACSPAMVVSAGNQAAAAPCGLLFF